MAKRTTDESIEGPVFNADGDRIDPTFSQNVTFDTLAFADRSAAQERLAALLNKPLEAHEIEVRTGGGGMMLRYISTPAVIRRMNEIFGPTGWTTSLGSRSHFNDEKGNIVFAQEVSVTAHFDGFYFDSTDIGTGSTHNLRAESIEMAIKGAVSDGIKRAVYRLGDALGLGLRDDGVVKEERAERSAPRGTGARPALGGNSPAVTEPQRKFIQDLFEQKSGSLDVLYEHGLSVDGDGKVEFGDLTISRAKDLIDELKLVK